MTTSSMLRRFLKTALFAFVLIAGWSVLPQQAFASGHYETRVDTTCDWFYHYDVDGMVEICWDSDPYEVWVEDPAPPPEPEPVPEPVDLPPPDHTVDGYATACQYLFVGPWGSMHQEWVCADVDMDAPNVIWDNYYEQMTLYGDGWIPEAPVIETDGQGRVTSFHSWICGDYRFTYHDPQPCTVSNACGATATGSSVDGGACSATAPALPTGYGTTCYSPANACGATTGGTIGCGGCTAPTYAPALPDTYDKPCPLTSGPNACNQTTTDNTAGRYNCSNSCVGTPPAAPSNASCPAPDVTAGAVSPTAATAGVSTSLSATISNIGTGGTGSGFPNYFIIRNAANGGGGDVLAQNPTVGALGVGATGTASVSYAFPSAGTYSAVVCADFNSGWGSTIGESNESNNCGPWTNIDVGAAPVPDLTAGGTSVSNANAGQSIPLSASVSNIGTATASNFPNIFQIADSAVSYTVRMVDSGSISSLGASASTNISATTSALPEGTYNVRACANYNSSWGGSISESNINNNCGDWSTFSVRDSDRDVSCSPANQTVSTTASWSAHGGSSYTWKDALGNTIGSGSSLSQTYAANGNYAVTVKAGGFTSSACNVTVTGAGNCSMSAPTGDLAADSYRVKQGTATTLRWNNVHGVHGSCDILTTSGGTFAPDTQCDVASGSRSSGTITTQTTYTLRCDGSNVDSVTIDVIPKVTEF